MYKKTRKPEIAIVRAKRRFLSMEGQGESDFQLVALPKIGSLTGELGE